MRARSPQTARRLVLIGVAVSLCATALLAIGILLFGNFGETEGRILGTTLMLAGYGLVALPAGFLLDQSRHRPLAGAVIALAATGLALALVECVVRRRIYNAQKDRRRSPPSSPSPHARPARSPHGGGKHEASCVGALLGFSCALALLLAGAGDGGHVGRA